MKRSRQLCSESFPILGVLEARSAVCCSFEHCPCAYVQAPLRVSGPPRQNVRSIEAPNNAESVNLGSHKSAALRRIIKAAGARLWYLPPYSPDLNPIEQTFAKIKHWMRAAQKRTIDDISRHLGELIQTIQPDECKNYFANAGYASIKT